MGAYNVRQYQQWTRLRKQTGFRSQFEQEVDSNFPDNFERAYEAVRVPFTVTMPRHYLPDWILPEQAIVLEAKGRFTMQDRSKMLIIKRHYPQLDVRLIFQNPNQKLGKELTAARWCERNGFPYCKGPCLPMDWLTHKPTGESRQAFDLVFRKYAKKYGEMKT